MASPITPSTGLGSGLAIGEIVSALVNADKLASQTQITAQNKLVTAKLSGIGVLQSAISAFQTSLKGLGNNDDPVFSGYAAHSSNESMLTVKSDNSAVPGHYSIDISQVATSSSIATAAVAGNVDSPLPAGHLTIIQSGKSKDYTLPAGGTLASIAKQINADSKTTHISANVITDAQGSRLIIGSTLTGAGSDITTSSDIDGFTIPVGVKLDPAVSGAAGYIGDRAQDAHLSINGFQITSASNSVDKSLGGLALSLVGKGSATVGVNTNTDGLKSALQSFIDGYNNVVAAVVKVTTATINDTPDPVTGASVLPASLTGDALPRAILAAMRNVLVTSGGATGSIFLSQLGITTNQSDGKLALDDRKYATAVNDQGLAGSIQQLFSGTGESDGLISRMTAAFTPYAQTGGIFDSRETSLNNQRKALDRQQLNLDVHVTNLTQALTAKYNAMDSLVGQLKASASNITSFFDSLNAQKGN